MQTPIRADREQLNAQIAEAIARCEAAQERFEEINEELQRAIREGRRITSPVVADEAQARKSLYVARVRLSERLSMRRRLMDQ
jgi:hypothetical protein